MSTKKRALTKEICFFQKGLSAFRGLSSMGLADLPLGKHFKKLRKMVKKQAENNGLTIVDNPQKAKYMVITYADIDNDDGYDYIGYNCFKKSLWGKFPNISFVAYCGFYGSVHKIHFTTTNSKILYLGVAL